MSKEQIFLGAGIVAWVIFLLNHALSHDYFFSNHVNRLFIFLNKKIGNSQGVRIPKPLLDQTGIKGDVEMEVEKSQIIITANLKSEGRMG